MKKYAIPMLMMLVAMILLLVGCNKTLIDTTYKFDYAIVALSDGSVVEGEVESWSDYEDGDQIQVRIDGKTYLVHSSNASLIAE